MGTFRHFQIFYLLDNPHFQEVAKKKSPAEQKSEARTRKTQRLRAESMSKKAVNLQDAKRMKNASSN